MGLDETMLPPSPVTGSGSSGTKRQVAVIVSKKSIGSAS